MEQSQNRSQRPGDGPGERGEGEAVTKEDIEAALHTLGRSFAEVLARFAGPAEALAEAEAGPAEGTPEDIPEAREPEAEAVVPHQAAEGYPGAVIEHPSGECAWCDALRWRELVEAAGDGPDLQVASAFAAVCQSG